MRESAVLGLVGAGGIGMAIDTAMNLFQWERVALMLVAIFAVVIVAEVAVTCDPQADHLAGASPSNSGAYFTIVAGVGCAPASSMNTMKSSSTPNSLRRPCRLARSKPKRP